MFPDIAITFGVILQTKKKHIPPITYTSVSEVNNDRPLALSKHLLMFLTRRNFIFMSCINSNILFSRVALVRQGPEESGGYLGAEEMMVEMVCLGRKENLVWMEEMGRRETG